MERPPAEEKVIGKVRDFESIEQSPDCPRIHKTLAIPRDLHVFDDTHPHGLRINSGEFCSIVA